MCLLILLWACQPEKATEQNSERSDVDRVRTKAESVNDFQIVAGLRVGPVRHSTSEAELLRLLGPDVVTVGDSIYGAEGDVLIGTTLYKDTADQLQILYQDSAQRQHPELVLIRPYVTDADGNSLSNGKPTRWSTANGVHIGMSLKELEQCNGKPFRLWGFGWDYGGSVANWQGGRFDMGTQTMLSVTLAPPSTLSPAQTRALATVSGDGEFMSTNPSMQLLGPVVQIMQVTLKP
jgi:hypothetical protein